MQVKENLNWTKADFDKLTDFLPTDYLLKISESINHKISTRQIRFVLKGEQKDYHGVINALLKIAAKHRSKLEFQKKQLNKFSN